MSPPIETRLPSNPQSGTGGGQRPQTVPNPSVPPPPRGTVAPGGQAVFIETGSVDAALARALTNALKEAGVTVQAGAAGARLTVRPEVTVTLRPAFTGSGTTADYVGSIRIQNRATATTESVPVQGNALEFGEAVARAAALEEAAKAMAEAVSKAVRD